MIGIFDSGVGGLTLMREYLRQYPEFDYIYLGDQANVPYGNRSRERVIELVKKNVDFLVRRGCKLILIACNTASADALRHVQQIYKGKPVILGVLIPAVEEALKKTRFGRIGVIGTKGTVGSQAYEREIKKYAQSLYRPQEKSAEKEVKVITQACPLLVPLIEEGLEGNIVTCMLLKNYLRPFKNAHADTLILGCTHYPVIQKEIGHIMGRRVTLISSAAASANAIGDYFKRHLELKKSLSAGGFRLYLTTDSPERFAELGGKLLGQKIKAEKVEI